MTLIHRKIDLTTGEVVDTPYTPEELAEAELAAQKEAEKIAAYEAKKASREALLDKLGITADEAKLLLGGN